MSQMVYDNRATSDWDASRVSTWGWIKLGLVAATLVYFFWPARRRR